MRPIYLTDLNRQDVEAAALSDDEVLAAVETGLAMQGRDETAIEPRVHLEPRAGVDGHFNVLRGWIGGAVDAAGVKVVGDLVDNHLQDHELAHLPFSIFFRLLRALPFTHPVGP